MAVASGGFSNRPFRSDLYVSQGAQSIPGNYSSVSWGLYIVQTGGYDTYWYDPDRYWSVNVEGNVWSGNFSYDFRNYDSLYLAGTSLNIGHNADGTRSISFSSYIDGGSDGIGTASAWGSMGLTTIPRASTPTLSPSTLDAGTVMSLNTNRASSGFTHNITWIFGSQSGSVGTGIGQTASWTPPLSLLTEIPNAAQGNGTIRTVTYSGTTYIGQTDVTFYLRAPDSTAPTIAVPEITDSEAVPLVATTVGAYVQKLSKLTVTINTATPQYGATIPSNGYKIEVAGQTINAQTGTTPDVIGISGTVPIKITVTDSRGKSRVVTKNVTVLAWAVPLIDLNGTVAIRTNSAGVAQEDGAYIKVHLKGTISSLVNGTQKNAISYQIWSRPRGGTTWTSKLSLTPGGTVIDADLTPISSYGPESAWEIRIDFLDKFATTTLIATIAVGQVFIHFGQSGQGVGFGKYWERGAIDALGKIYASDFMYVKDGRVLLQGTTAQRDAIFGDPGSTANQVALANLQPVWYNTDYGWEEQYYVVNGTTGLTVRGLVTGSPVGWYPRGDGPTIELVPTAEFTVNASSGSPMNVRGWGTLGTGFSRRVGGSFFLSYDDSTGAITMKLAGMYRVFAKTTLTNGSGTCVFHLMLGPSSSPNNVWDSKYTLDGSYLAVMSLEHDGYLAQANDIAFVRCWVGSLAIHKRANIAGTLGGEFYVQYMGPPLVSN